MLLFQCERLSIHVGSVDSYFDAHLHTNTDESDDPYKDTNTNTTTGIAFAFNRNGSIPLRLSGVFAVCELIVRNL